MIILLTVLAFGVSALFSGMETGLYTTSRLRLYLDSAAGHPAARRVLTLLEDLPLLLAVLLVANNLANGAASYLMQVALEDLGVRQAALVGTVIVTGLLFVFGESMPKEVFRRAQHRLLYPVLPALSVAHRILAFPVRPIAGLATWLSELVARRSGRLEQVVGERQALLHAGSDEGFLTTFQHHVADGVLALRQRTAADEARSATAHPTARLGAPGVRLPENGADHRVLVLDVKGKRIAGWVPLAVLWAPTGFRPPKRRDLRPVARVRADASLDRVLLTLERARTPFGVLIDGEQLSVVDTNRLRHRVLVGADIGSGAVATPPEHT